MGSMTLYKYLIIFSYSTTVEQNITNFAIGVGNYQVKELREFANGDVSNERVYTSTDFNSLSSVLTELEDELQQSGFFCGMLYI